MTRKRSSGRNAVGGRSIPLGRLIILLQALLAVAFTAYLLAHQVGFEVPLLSDKAQVRAQLDDAAGLAAEDKPSVTIAGVDVGYVSKVSYKDGRALVVLEIEDRARDMLRSDARVSVAPRSVLNDLVVELDPGHSPERLPGDRVVRPAASATPVALDRVIGVLDADTRAYLQILLGELDTGLDGRSTQLRAALGELGRASTSSASVADALADRRRQLTALVGELNVILRALGDRGGELEQTIAAGRRTLEVTAGHEADLSDSFRQLPDTLAALDGAMTELRGLAVPLNPALEQLRPSARRLPAALRSLRTFVPHGRALVTDLGALVETGGPRVDELRRAVAALGVLAEQFRRPVADLLPVLRAIDVNKAGIPKLAENFSGVFSTNDANGPMLRGLGFFEDFKPENFGFPGGARGARLARTVDGSNQVTEMKADAIRALMRVCRTENEAACAVPFLVPGLGRDGRAGPTGGARP